jgi:hypothetical protein
MAGARRSRPTTAPGAPGLCTGRPRAALWPIARAAGRQAAPRPPAARAAAAARPASSGAPRAPHPTAPTGPRDRGPSPCPARQAGPVCAMRCGGAPPRRGPPPCAATRVCLQAAMQAVWASDAGHSVQQAAAVAGGAGHRAAKRQGVQTGQVNGCGAPVGRGPPQQPRPSSRVVQPRVGGHPRVQGARPAHPAEVAEGRKHLVYS